MTKNLYCCGDLPQQTTETYRHKKKKKLNFGNKYATRHPYPYSKGIQSYLSHGHSSFLSGAKSLYQIATRTLIAVATAPSPWHAMATAMLLLLAHAAITPTTILTSIEQQESRA